MDNSHVAEPFRSILNTAPAVREEPKPVPMWRGTKIETDYVFPPIPDRRFDWCAVTEDYDGAEDSNHPIGYGRTEQEAIADLIEQLEDEE